MNRNINATQTLPGAVLAGTGTPLHTQLSRAGQRAWTALQRYGERRASEHLRLLAIQYTHSNPELAQRLKHASDEYRRTTS